MADKWGQLEEMAATQVELLDLLRLQHATVHTDKAKRNMLPKPIQWPRPWRRGEQQERRVSPSALFSRLTDRG